MRTNEELDQIARRAIALNGKQQEKIEQLLESNDKLIAQNKQLVAEVERLKSAPSQIIEVLKKLKDDAETTSKENPPTDDCGGEFDAIWINDLNGLIEEASWQFQEQAND